MLLSASFDESDHELPEEEPSDLSSLFTIM